MSPYITSKEREEFKYILQAINEKFMFDITPGQLNYLITSILLEYINIKGESYTYHNDILGVLDAVRQEWYRRMVSKYEDKKIHQNGDLNWEVE